MAKLNFGWVLLFHFYFNSRRVKFFRYSFVSCVGDDEGSTFDWKNTSWIELMNFYLHKDFFSLKRSFIYLDPINECETVSRTCSLPSEERADSYGDSTKLH